MPIDSAHPGTGDTALHYAVRANDDVTVRYLVACGCNVNVQNHKGETPLHLASHKAARSDLYVYLSSLPNISFFLRDASGNLAAFYHKY